LQASVGNSEKLATLVQARLIECTPQTNRGVHADVFAEFNCAAMNVKAAVLVELAFMTNQREAEKLMANEKFWVEAAEKICHAVCEYASVAYKTLEGNTMEAWETEIADKALVIGIITDAMWKEKLDEAAPVWMVLALANKHKTCK